MRIEKLVLTVEDLHDTANDLENPKLEDFEMFYSHFGIRLFAQSDCIDYYAPSGRIVFLKQRYL